MTVVCPVCKREFKSFHAMKTHFMMVHSGCINDATCPVCGYRAYSYRGLITHIARKADSDVLHAMLYALLVNRRNRKKKLAAKIGVDAFERGIKIDMSGKPRPPITITIEVDEYTYNALVEEAVRRGKSITEIARMIISEWATRRERNDKHDDTL